MADSPNIEPGFFARLRSWLFGDADAGLTRRSAGRRRGEEFGPRWRSYR